MVLMRRLDHLQQVIDELGGSAACGRLTGHTPQAVDAWRRRGVLPAKTFIVLQRALLDHAAIAPASLWGMVEPAPPVVIVPLRATE